MKDYAMFRYDFLFGDHFAKVSAKAKLLYVNLGFYADAGFVANPRQICKSMGYDDSVLDELIKNGELLTLQGRSEMFISSYFVHNKNFKRLSWLSTTFGEYWKNKMWMKENGIATLNKQTKLEESKKVEEKPVREEIDPTLPNSAKVADDPELSQLLADLNRLKVEKNVTKK